MSWSVNAEGTPKQVKESLATQFGYSKTGTESVPTEHRAVCHAEMIVNDILSDMISSEYSWVKVNGGGSGTVTNPTHGWKGNVQFNLSVMPMVLPVQKAG